ncbi:acyl-homoserine-lactone synthase [Cohaesibacter celericrescens]|uniref:acyl-homoserine-lactone synthase n=1 Tax=Cohaesibacter celericrescens TaxID=2067669 RepID=UPI00356717E2
MFITVQAHEYQKNLVLMDQMFKLRKKVFGDQLKWDVPIIGQHERDIYDEKHPVYLVWCSDNRQTVYGMMRLMPTTGPTLLYDVFRKTFPKQVSLSAPGIWEGTRMCIDEDALAVDYPEMEPARAFSMMFVALCECAIEHGIHTMVSNYEPQMKRVYRRAGVEVNELGRADGYGKRPVCCGMFEVSKEILETMRSKVEIQESLYSKAAPYGSLVAKIQKAA